MRPVLDTDAIRRLEDIIEKEGTSRAELMELAGEFVASVALEYKPKRVVALAGFGNNGGDAWVAADILQHKGVHVDVVTPVEPDEIPAALARHVARRSAGRDVAITVGPSKDELAELLDSADVIIDAMLGIGFHGTVRAPFTIWIPTVNAASAPVVSVDVPSGLNVETGIASDACIHADITATLLAEKIGLFSAGGPGCAGEIRCGSLYAQIADALTEVDKAAEFVEPADLAPCLQDIPPHVDKYARGSVLVVAGSSAYPGAAMLAAQAAARAGAGYVAVATPETCANLIRMALPSIPVIAVPADARGSFGAAAKSVISEIAEKYDCVLCGPGITTAAGSAGIVTMLLEMNVPLILDADALNCLSRVTIDGLDSLPEVYRREAPLLLTPHYRELARLVSEGDVHDLVSSIQAAQKILWAAGSSNMAIVAKGPTTAVVGVEQVFIPQAGPVALATAGSGDVLAGILAGIVATLQDEPESWELLASYAVTIHSQTGYLAASTYGSRSVMASDLPDLIGPALQLVEDEVLEALARGKEA
ncbi:NAD(P)H-hydrate dehydratase [Collinsella sp. zg1085]|uniref:NAD(P)H-hydrate dehydratase n=1 Tax=Collinsella sp. zg1085 TaxID=2844380 RepID=UPI001C0B71CF|nr:NAD(P)H-hydrate dehydratase [Collinsella sp. zg1085]QWT17709.1 NAD(P)H-hydrate dehydratase [Collinsella sp. zg1085]